MNTSSIPSRRVLSVFVLTMINVAAITSLRGLPLTSTYGLGLVFIYIIAAIAFFIPVSLVSAELATAIPKAGGAYIWIEEAFGSRLGFLAIWMQFIENIIWFPTVLAFAAATMAYFINPDLAHNKVYLLITILVIYWVCTLINLLGMKVSGWVSTIGVLIGTVLPGLFIILMGIVWIASGHRSQISLSFDSFIPNFDVSNLVFIAGVVLGLAGIEMSAVHAREVKNPRVNYSKAILCSVVIILILLVVASLAIAIVIPKNQISLVAGVMEAFSIFLKAYNLVWLIPVIASCMALGTFSQVSTWIIGPVKGLYITARHGILPPFFQKANKKQVPIALLLFQGVIVTPLAFIFIIMPDINSSYWILTALTTQVYLIFYILLLAAGIRLRYSKPTMERSYKVFGGKLGMWLVAGLGLIASIATFFIGFVPPDQIQSGSLIFYESFLIIGIAVLIAIPLIVHHFKKPEWKAHIEHNDHA